MPRKSAAALSVVRLDPSPKLPSPRKECSAEVKALFNEILSQASKDQFRQTDGTLLELYCLAVLEARLAYRHLETEGRTINSRLNPWVSILEKANKAVVSLSVRLRLGPKSRLDSRSDKLKGPPPSAYELLRNETD